MKFLVWSDESAAAASGEAQPPETPPPALVHVEPERDHRVVTARERVVVEAPGGEQDEGVEDLLVEAGGVLERGVAVLDGARQAPEERGIVRGVLAQVGQAEGHVPRLVLAREPRHLARHRIGRVRVQEAQEREEAPLPQHREQEARLGKSGSSTSVFSDACPPPSRAPAPPAGA